MTDHIPHFSPNGGDPSRGDFPDDFPEGDSGRRRLPRWLWVIAGLSTFSIITLGIATSMWLSSLGGISEQRARLQVIRDWQPHDNSIVYDRDQTPIGEFFTSYHVFVPYGDIPAQLVQAIIAVEDRNFWTHPGFDLRGIARAAWLNVRGNGTAQGASTITQQVVRNFLLTRDKTFGRKGQEIVLAALLERDMEKQKIFEIYANAMFLGNGAYGVGAAARRYFNKPVQDLNLMECAVIAGLFKSPSTINPVKDLAASRRRAVLILRRMALEGFISPKEGQAALQSPFLVARYEPLNAKTAPYFIDYVREQVDEILSQQSTTLSAQQQQGLRIYTTLDSRLQALAEETMRNQSGLLDSIVTKSRDGSNDASGKAILEASLIAIDPRSGDILAMQGGRDYRKSQFNRTVASLRSPGSAIKPVIYSLALMNGHHWNDLFYLSPVNIGNYQPRNSSGESMTSTTMLRAFYKSLNTPTVEIAEKLGIKAVIDHAKNLGIHSPMKEEFGSALGSSAVTSLDLARMYSVFANQGALVETVSITRIESRDGDLLYEAPPLLDRTRAVMPPDTAYQMIDGMRDVLLYGTGARASALADRAVGKTGTSNDSVDNWFSGMTPELVATVWVGSDENLSLPSEAAGSTLALPIWQEFMAASIATRSPARFQEPAGLVTYKIDPVYGYESDVGIPTLFLASDPPPSKSPTVLEVTSHRGSFRDIFTPR